MNYGCPDVRRGKLSLDSLRCRFVPAKQRDHDDRNERCRKSQRPNSAPSRTAGCYAGRLRARRLFRYVARTHVVAPLQRSMTDCHGPADYQYAHRVKWLTEEGASRSLADRSKTVLASWIAILPAAQ